MTTTIVRDDYTMYQCQFCLVEYDYDEEAEECEQAHEKLRTEQAEGGSNAHDQ